MWNTKPDQFAVEALEFCENINRLKSPSSMTALVFSTLARLGFEHVTCAAIPAPGQSPLGGILINNRPAEYLQRYHERGYATKDPVVTELKRTLQPYSWSDVRSRRRLSREQLSIMGEAIDFGATDGLIIPIVSTSGSRSIFAPCGRQPILTARARSAVEIIGIAAHQAIRRSDVAHSQPTTEHLSGREREVLQWMAVGKSIDEISDILFISSTTVRTHLDHAKRKLNTTKAVATVVEAIRRGEIAL